MFDALFYCRVMADIRHGYFLVVADFFRTIAVQFRALCTTALRTLAHGTLAHRTLAHRTSAHGTLAQRTRQTPVACRQREAWMQSLARLEAYVASMA
jgi:hypothetical protein